ncbi:potassium channel family protein [Salinimicrobium terrae]|uniref:potassium channel family protein n=1 Tax=Salinimicrobium terrae TaxID=470866 RepID=UPI00146C7348|nr:potassium channel family protein [Salinimicrobium terrae]
MEIFYLFIGVFILMFTIYDFFFTTLSGSGAGFISEHTSIFSDRIIQKLVKVFGRSIYKTHGLFVNLMVLAVWILLVWLGLFLVYSWNPEAITNSNGRPANFVERLYYTGYILSTLGLGNFKPTSEFYEIVTALFSIFGFIFFTSSMTYFISVSSALVNKRTLTKSIFNLGKSPGEIANKILSLNSSYAYQQLLNLQEMIDKHSVNHHAYPVIHYYTEAKPKNCLSLNLTRLDEALSILIDSEDGRELQQELEPVRSSITYFLENLSENFSRSLPTVENPVDKNQLPYSGNVLKGEDLKNRRRVLEKLFKSEDFTWKDVLGNA